MQTVMFTETIFGPIHSRRLGTSLGINLCPRDGKICSFDCLYCEAGYNAQGKGTTGMPSRTEVRDLLRERLSAMHTAGEHLDVITFSGNGEPTVNPDFPEIVEDTIELRNEYFPNARVCVLTNSTMLGSRLVMDALREVDSCMLKLDSAIDSTIHLLDRPVSPEFTAEKVISQLADFGPSAVIQTMFTRGTHDGEVVDNTTEEEIDALIDAYKRIRPREITIYSLDRPTPETNLRRVPKEELEAIGQRISAATGIKVSVA